MLRKQDQAEAYQAPNIRPDDYDRSLMHAYFNLVMCAAHNLSLVEHPKADEIQEMLSLIAFAADELESWISLEKRKAGDGDAQAD